ncbi:hypothetical protein C8F01DRAFT_1120173 [Mycena amicta]|nr:hypothetical protein C8F01DRAFT_1120173 [Mycena amicta]
MSSVLSPLCSSIALFKLRSFPNRARYWVLNAWMSSGSFGWCAELASWKDNEHNARTCITSQTQMKMAIFISSSVASWSTPSISFSTRSIHLKHRVESVAQCLLRRDWKVRAVASTEALSKASALITMSCSFLNLFLFRQAALRAASGVTSVLERTDRVEASNAHTAGRPIRSCPISKPEPGAVFSWACRNSLLASALVLFSPPHILVMVSSMTRIKRDFCYNAAWSLSTFELPCTRHYLIQTHTHNHYRPRKRKSKVRRKSEAPPKFWEASPSPSVEAGEDQDWDMAVVGEEVGLDGEINWERPDGTNTTWQSRDSLVGVTLPTVEWEAQRKTALRTDGQTKVWSPHDAVNELTWERRQGFTPPPEEEFQRQARAVREDRERLMAWHNSGAVGPHPLASQNAQAKRSSPSQARQRNAEAGPSRSRQSHASTSSKAAQSQEPPTRPRAISVSSSESVVEIMEFQPTTEKPPKHAHVPSPAPGTPSTAASRTRNPTPSISRKRKASPLLLRTCANGCGTQLAPPDVYRRDVCDTCYSPKKHKADDGGSSRVGSLRISETVKREKSASIKSETRSTKSKSTSIHVEQDRPKAPLPTRKGKERAAMIKSRRLQVETQWSAIAAKSGAATIVFVNDLDDEELPSSISDEFEYMEDEYACSESLGQVDGLHYNPESKQIEPPGVIFTKCDCRPADLVGGLDCSDKVDAGYAYNEGLFNFSYRPSEVIIECNAYCACSMDCGNRVAQRPRIVPIEIFKTQFCGWGVRSSGDVRKGQVLGLYTGKLMCTLTGVQREFSFDPGLSKDEQQADEDGLLSIDSWQHACRIRHYSRGQPLNIWFLLWLTVLQQNAGYLAFIACKFIGAGTEFTFDYSPASPDTDHPKPKGRRKGKSRKTSVKPVVGEQRCRCGSEFCRGILWKRH